MKQTKRNMLVFWLMGAIAASSAVGFTINGGNPLLIIVLLFVAAAAIWNGSDCLFWLRQEHLSQRDRANYENQKSLRIRIRTKQWDARIGGAA